MTALNKTDITVVLDKSGSMSCRRLETIEGFNEFLRDQKATSGECTLTLVQFSTSRKTYFDNLDIREVPNLDTNTYAPDGLTALLDAIGANILKTGARLRALPEDDRPAKVMFLIITDGHENASREWQANQIKEMIEHQEEVYEWEFLYIGAGQNAINVGSKYGIKASKALGVGTSGQAQNNMWRTASRSVASYRTMGKPHDEQFFTQAERQTAADLGGQGNSGN